MVVDWWDKAHTSLQLALEPNLQSSFLWESLTWCEAIFMRSNDMACKPVFPLPMSTPAMTSLMDHGPCVWHLLPFNLLCVTSECSQLYTGFVLTHCSLFILSKHPLLAWCRANLSLSPCVVLHLLSSLNCLFSTSILPMWGDSFSRFGTVITYINEIYAWCSFIVSGF